MQITQLKNLFAKATIVFTITTALLLLSLIWEVFGWGNDLIEKMVATSITLAAFSFVSFLVANFAKK